MGTRRGRRVPRGLARNTMNLDFVFAGILTLITVVCLLIKDKP
jgi:hypothetical protein